MHIASVLTQHDTVTLKILVGSALPVLFLDEIQKVTTHSLGNKSIVVADRAVWCLVHAIVCQRQHFWGKVKHLLFNKLASVLFPDSSVSTKLSTELLLVYVGKCPFTC